MSPKRFFLFGMFKGPFDPFERTAAAPMALLFTSIEENMALCHIFEISCGAPSDTRPWTLRRAGKFPLPGLPAGVGGVGCSSTPGRPSTIENDFTAACAQYVSTPRKRKSAWCPRHATRRQPAPSRTCGPGSTRHRESSIRKQHASDAATIPRGSGAGAVTRSSRPAPDYPCELVRVARVFGWWTSRVYPTPSSQCHA